MKKTIPNHVAIIMDGNGRWAKKKHLPVSFGHTQGSRRLKDVLKVCENYNIKHLTLFAFSTENWKREADEINHLLGIIKNFYKKEFNKLIKNEIRINFIGSKLNIPQDILDLFEDMEKKSKQFEKIILNIAFNYGSKEEIVSTVNGLIKSGKTQITEEDISSNLYTKGQPDVDLLIRTSGEQRISNFLMWQSAYAEFIFPSVLWPDFKEEEFEKCLEIFAGRNRRFGGR